MSAETGIMRQKPGRPRGRRLAAMATAGGAIVAAAYGAALYLESFAAPEGCCLASAGQPNPIQVERLLDQADPKGLSASLQDQAARDTLAARPVDASAWLRLAYADALRNRLLTPQGVYAFKTSYTMAAYAGINAAWRVAFALNHWDELDPDTKRQVVAELKALRLDAPRLDAARVRIGRVTNPVGRYYAFLYDMLPPPEPDAGR